MIKSIAVHVMSTKRDQIQARIDNANALFSGNNPVEADKSIPGSIYTTQDKWRKLERLMIKKVSKWWEATTLEKYKECGRVS